MTSINIIEYLKPNYIVHLVPIVANIPSIAITIELTDIYNMILI